MWKKIFTLFSIFFSCAYAEIPEPYNSIHTLPFDGHGWFLDVNARHLKEFIQQINPKTVVEVGSWLGSSTRFIASNMQEQGILYAVDTWNGSVEHEGDPRLSSLYQQFLSNVIHTGLTDKIIPVRMTSLEAAKALNIQADLIYLDGAHDTDSVREDILHWHPHLNEGGIFCGDDWGWQSVQVGVIQAAVKLGKGLYFDDNFWWLQ